MHQGLLLHHMPLHLQSGFWECYSHAIYLGCVRYNGLMAVAMNTNVRRETGSIFGVAGKHVLVEW